MGVSKGKSQSGSGSADFAAPTISGDQLESQVIAKLPGADMLKMRMAGDKLSDIGALNSIAEASTQTKYAPDMPTKAPSSQYLSYSAAPSRLSGF
jgi:hypothetical protein